MYDSRPDYPAFSEAMKTPLVGGMGRTYPIVGIAETVVAPLQAALVNVTVTNTDTDGYLTLRADPSGPPTTSTVNWGANQTVANMAVVPCGPGSSIAAWASSACDVVLDLLGFYY